MSSRAAPAISRLPDGTVVIVVTLPTGAQAASDRKVAYTTQQLSGELAQLADVQRSRDNDGTADMIEIAADIIGNLSTILP